MTRRDGGWWIDYNHGPIPYFYVNSMESTPPKNGWVGYPICSECQNKDWSNDRPEVKATGASEVIDLCHWQPKLEARKMKAEQSTFEAIGESCGINEATA